MNLAVVWLLAMVAGATAGFVFAVAGARGAAPIFGAMIVAAIVRFTLGD
jgi:hypothetical protein